MKPAILLIDLQNDFLRYPSLEPAPGQVVQRATALLEGSRKQSLPIIHVWTSVQKNDDRRMPHWKRDGRWMCVHGTDGHAPPEPLRPLAGEPIIHKTFFSAFSNGELERVLRSLGAEAVLLAGVHLHACIRATALDAYQRGLQVSIAEDAVASDDPLHAAITQRYLEKRAARFVTVESFLASAATSRNGANRVAKATVLARRAWSLWKSSQIRTRVRVLERLATLLEEKSTALARQIALEVGKPITQAKAEVGRGAALIRAVIRSARGPLDLIAGKRCTVRYRPVGVIAMITPWNNPIAIPIGKIAPALLYGNTVVWKPSPFAESLANELMTLLKVAGLPDSVVELVKGDRLTALELMNDPQVDAVTITGSVATGYVAQDVCAQRHIPIQAELGGNNAAIVWSDCDLKKASAQIAEGAFGFAGQRCTANRRVIVDANCYEKFLKKIKSATAALVWGDPLNPKTQIGPLISIGACNRAAESLARARGAAKAIITPHKIKSPSFKDRYFPPTIVCCDDPSQEIVQEESFGPVLVVQRANDWDHAVRLCNGVRHGLVAALFSRSKKRQAEFLEQAQAGILKINSATADANAEASFGGWKASGIGPPEHGPSDREFYSRTQTVYK